MARIWHCGFELQSVTAAVEFDSVFDVPTISTSIKRSGAASGRISSLTSGTRQGFEHRCFNAGQDSEQFARFAIYITTLPSGDNTIAHAGGSTPSGNVWSIKLTSAGTLKLFNGATQLGSTSATTLSTGQWYVIEVRWKSNVGAGADEVTVRIDGSTEANLTVTTATLATYTHIGLWGNGSQEAQTQGDWHFDDWALNDISGTVQNSWCGHTGKLACGFANAAGEFASTLTLVPGGGESAFQDVDDNPSPDDATTYATLTTNATNWTTGSRLMVGVTNPSGMGIGSGDTIVVVTPGARIRNDGSGLSSHVFAAQTANGGTKAESAAVAFNPGAATWLPNDDTAGSRVYKLVMYVDPDGAAWSPAASGNLETLQIGLRASDAAPDVDVTQMWAYVEYIPAAGGGGGKPWLHYARQMAA